MRRYTALALVASLAFNLVSALLWAEKSPAGEQDDFTVLREAIDVVQKNLYGKEPTRRELIEAAIEGMLLKVDPDGAYFDHDDLSHYNQSVRVKRAYVGLDVRLERHLVVVGSRMGSSAFRAGIRPGARILEIDGVSVADMSLIKAVHSLVGSPNTKVSVKVMPAPADQV